jgi:membrane protease YdiL (CAAX protease family)
MVLISMVHESFKERLQNHKYVRVSFDDFRRAPIYIIIMVILTTIGSNIFFNNYIREKGTFQIIEERTDYLIQDSLVIYYIKISLIIILLILLLGRLKLKDIGLEKRNILPAVVLIISIWLFYQIIGLIYTFAVNGKVVFDDFILNNGWNVVLGQSIAQFFGCGPYEEIIYRVFFIVQIYLLISKKKEENQGKISKKALTISLISTQIFFALIHIPDRIWENQPLEEYWMDMFSLFMYGVVFALLYLRTNNILIVAGIHALLNWTVSLFMPQFYGWIIIWISYIVILVFYPIIIDKITGRTEEKQEVKNINT